MRRLKGRDRRLVRSCVFGNIASFLKGKGHIILSGVFLGSWGAEQCWLCLYMLIYASSVFFSPSFCISTQLSWLNPGVIFSLKIACMIFLWAAWVICKNGHLVQKKNIKIFMFTLRTTEKPPRPTRAMHIQKVTKLLRDIKKAMYM